MRGTRAQSSPQIYKTWPEGALRAEGGKRPTLLSGVLRGFAKIPVQKGNLVFRKLFRSPSNVGFCTLLQKTPCRRVIPGPRIFPNPPLGRGFLQIFGKPRVGGASVKVRDIRYRVGQQGRAALPYSPLTLRLRLAARMPKKARAKKVPQVMSRLAGPAAKQSAVVASTAWPAPRIRILKL